jgi:hypothetical protein
VSGERDAVELVEVDVGVERAGVERRVDRGVEVVLGGGEPAVLALERRDSVAATSLHRRRSRS